MKHLPKIDIGLVWAKVVNIWGQLGTVAGIANTIMLLIVTYTTTIEPKFHTPLWLYIAVIIIAFAVGVYFILKVGISGYYRFLSNQSELSEVHRKLNLVMKQLNIEDNNADKK